MPEEVGNENIWDNSFEMIYQKPRNHRRRNELVPTTKRTLAKVQLAALQE